MYEFNETLAKEVENLGIADKPEALYNCDKPGFPVESSKCKYIGPTGKKKPFRLLMEPTERIKKIILGKESHTQLFLRFPLSRNPRCSHLSWVYQENKSTE